MAILKAFVLCNNITDNPVSRDQKDLEGAGLSRIEFVDPLPVKVSFWIFVQLADQNQRGKCGWRSCVPIRADAISSVRSPSGTKRRCKQLCSVFAYMIACFRNGASISLN